jgi:hypothetical protein
MLILHFFFCIRVTIAMNVFVLSVFDDIHILQLDSSFYFCESTRQIMLLTS